MSGSKFIYSKIIIIMIIYPSLKQRKALDFANKSSVANLKSYKDEQVPEEKKTMNAALRLAGSRGMDWTFTATTLMNFLLFVF